MVRECPFSDHKYVVATLESKSTRPIEEFCNLRNLNVKNQEIIKNIIDNFDFSDLDNILEINEKWLSFKNRILDAINSVSPLKQVKIKFLDENSPWVDEELKNMYLLKEYAHHIKCLSKAKIDEDFYKDIRKRCKILKN